MHGHRKARRGDVMAELSGAVQQQSEARRNSERLRRCNAPQCKAKQSIVRVGGSAERNDKF